MYRVFAYNVGGPSVSSNEIFVVTPGEIPQSPSDLGIKRIRGTSLELIWRDNANNEEVYYVERSLDGANFVRISTTGPNAISFTDVGLTVNTTYWYRVQAFNVDGVSEYSETVSGTTKKK